MRYVTLSFIQTAFFEHFVKTLTAYILLILLAEHENFV